ncbi:MAG TPA: FeoA domain-containing protein, partial [Bacillota bacterium]|nr:FeoA domain-containing protein [Bacillota bacterium]
LESVAGAMGANQNVAAETLSELEEAELLIMNGTAMRLSPEGERYALNIIRAHRLWEKHLAEQTGVAESQWHPQAEHQEHFITPQQANILAAELGNPPFDPHGDPIPDAQGDYVRLKGKPLSSLEPGVWVRVLHLEDEPEHVHAQIRAIGLCPGMRVRVLEKTHSRLRIWCDGEEHVLAPIVAANISGVVLPDAPAVEEGTGIPLSKVTPGQRARVLHISARCRGAERRRLMDLGILPGTVLCGELRSPAGELTAYRVREALIALRREQADLIQVTPEEKTAA